MCVKKGKEMWLSTPSTTQITVPNHSTISEYVGNVDINQTHTCTYHPLGYGHIQRLRDCHEHRNVLNE